ncbi:MAG: putative glycolipid-binding domain-containing protein [Actinomycetia bacterium]|nr:putative glycolipid-binding domain-containing protein [Actinomycetes bacterium]
MNISWTSQELSSTESFVLRRTEDGWSLAGEVALLIGGRPGRIEYEVVTDERWRTRSAEAHITTDVLETSVVIEASDELWRVDGEPRHDLARCVDVDLGWTPATNTLPMRRLGIGVGETAHTTAAWLRFPDLRVEASDQEYSRQGENLWRYRSGSADYLIETTPEMLVRRYGEDLWVADTPE